MAAPVPAGLGMTSWLGSPPTYRGLEMAAPVPAGLGMTSCWDPTVLPRAGDGSPCTSRTWYDELLGFHRPTAAWKMAAPVPAELGMTSCWDPTDLPRPGDGSPCTSRTLV